MRNQQINYGFGAPSLRQFRERKVNQGRQGLALHLATDITDRLELGFEPFPPATLSVSVSRCAVGCKDQSPVSADPCFFSQFIRIEAQRPFGVLLARLHGPAQLTPPEQIAQLPLQIQSYLRASGCWMLDSAEVTETVKAALRAESKSLDSVASLAEIERLQDRL